MFAPDLGPACQGGTAPAAGIIAESAQRAGRALRARCDAKLVKRANLATLLELMAVKPAPQDGFSRKATNHLLGAKYAQSGMDQ